MHLRPITLDDVDLLVALDADPEVMRFITGGRPSTQDEVEATVRRSLGFRWIATFRRGDGVGDFVGWFGLGANDRVMTDELEVGYRLARRSWGMGLATEGARRLVDHAFVELGARRVHAQTMTVNTRSRRVLEKCGLRYVRTFHLEWDEPIEGTADGDVEYELLRDDWRRPDLAEL